MRLEPMCRGWSTSEGRDQRDPVANSGSRILQEVQGQRAAEHCGKLFPVGSYVDLRSADASGVAREGGIEKSE